MIIRKATALTLLLVAMASSSCGLISSEDSTFDFAQKTPIQHSLSIDTETGDTVIRLAQPEEDTIVPLFPHWVAFNGKCYTFYEDEVTSSPQYEEGKCAYG